METEKESSKSDRSLIKRAALIIFEIVKGLLEVLLFLFILVLVLSIPVTVMAFAVAPMDLVADSLEELHIPPPLALLLAFLHLIAQSLLLVWIVYCFFNGKGKPRFSGDDDGGGDGGDDGGGDFDVDFGGGD